MDSKYWHGEIHMNVARTEILDDKRKLQKDDVLPSFSAGPRVCQGEPLAKIEVFLIDANYIKRFEFRRENDNVKH